MSQPPKFFLQVNNYCECEGCLRKIQKFQRYIKDNYGLPKSSFYLDSGRVEVIGDVDRSKQEELQELLHDLTTSEVCCGCFWKPKKKKRTTSETQRTTSETQLTDQLKNNNAGKDKNESEKDDGKASQQHPDAHSKRKGKTKIGEDGKGSPQIKGETSENMNQMGEESSQSGQYPRNLTTSESSQNDQMGQPPRGQTKAEYYPMDHTGINPMRQMGQMNGGYYQQPAHVPQTSPFSDDATADGCTFM